MKNNILLLLKIQLKNEIGRTSKSRGKAITIIGMSLIILILMIYAFFLAYGLGSIGMASLIPSFALAVTSVLILFTTILKANGVLFAYQEYDMLMALPIKTSVVITSRFLTMYLLNEAVAIAAMAPMGIGYVMWENVGLLFYLEWLIGMVFLPLIPTTLAAFVGALIILFSTRFKYANAVVTMVSVGFIGIVLFLSFRLTGIEEPQINITQVQTMGVMLLNQIHKLYPPSVLFDQAITGKKILSLVLFVFISVVWYTFFLIFVTKFYKKMNTALMTFHGRSHYKITEMKSVSPFLALTRKEIKRFFSSSVYCLNMGMGSLLTILCSITLLFTSTETLESYTANPQIWDTIYRVLPIMIGGMISMTGTTSVSLSLEGKNIWILKSLPIDAKTIFKSKIASNLILQIPPLVLAATIINIKLPMSFLMGILIFLVPILYGICTSFLGMIININMADYQWTSETALIKQSLPSIAGMLSGMIIGFGMAGAAVALKNIDAEIICIFIAVLLTLVSYFLWRYIKCQRL